jgi:hypothetical protein
MRADHLPVLAGLLDAVADVVDTATTSGDFLDRRLSESAVSLAQLLARRLGIDSVAATPPEQEHVYDGDSDMCRCGGQVVYFEDGDDRGDIGEGCEVAGLTWRSLDVPGRR